MNLKFELSKLGMVKYLKVYACAAFFMTCSELLINIILRLQET